MNLKPYFEKALPYEEYISLLGENLELYQHHYKKFTIPGAQEEKIRKYKSLKILVLAEPWCGDCTAILPIVGKIAETIGAWSVKVLLRDKNLDLMEQFLTRGGLAIPILLFLTEDYSLLSRWGPRPEVVQQIFEDHRSQIQDGKIEKSAVIKKIRNFYARDRGQAIMKDILNTLKKHM
ncbi:MAG: thioredoxin family protein [Candidatus Aminicenantes bacterium]|nr:thioredoxin family protein [Candidatus Aminicenantes bacterium]